MLYTTHLEEDSFYPKIYLIIFRATKTKIGRLWLTQRHAKRKISGTRGFGHM